MFQKSHQTIISQSYRLNFLTSLTSFFCRFH
nr:MAG TPA: hypothetical protein [Bacteriophage sp.]